MNLIKTIVAFLLLLVSANIYAQLGFCPGSKGEPLFSENFGNGTTYGPALPAGITTYPFVTGAPNDGFYTLFYQSSLYSTWHYSLDHTPDATNGPNGKMLIVNANAATSGDFYKKTVSGLCVNTTFEFSAWLLNVYNPGSNFCVGPNQIPINVRFEIWNASETILLGSGNTGNIIGTAAPAWQQFALVFTTVSETSVVLKMKNNGLGGCGNDLAIDDISFSACGDVTTVSSPSVAGNTYSTCTNPTSLQLNAVTASAVPYFYQWQTSPDGTIWTDIPAATGSTYTTPNLSALTYFRAKAAQDVANLSNIFCSTTSNVFTIDILAAPNPATSNGNRVICSDQPIPPLSVTAPAGANVNWYSAATGGTLLQSNNASYTPTVAGTYYAETYNATTNCIGSPRTQVQLTIVALPDVVLTGTTSICGGNTTVVNFTGTPNAIVTYTVNSGGNQTITLNASGLASVTTPILNATTTYTLVSVTSPALNTCSRTKNDVVTITVNNSATASFSGNPTVCQGNSATLNFTGTPNATVTYTAGSATQTVLLDASGNASVVVPSVTATTVYTLTNVAVGTCSQALSQSITVSMVAVPTASISASPLAVCSSQTSTINFSGTPNAIVTYKVNGGTNQTINLNASGLASLTTPALTANSTYTLVSAASAVLNTCIANLNNAVTVTVNALPTAAISSSAAAVCTGNPATINFVGTPNATVTYSAGSGNQTIALNAAGNASVVLPNVTATVVYSLIDVTSAGPNACTKALSQSISISAVALPTASISASPLSICANQTSTISFSGTPNAILTYTVNSGANQTITLNASGVASLITPALTANTTYTLVSAASAVLNTCSTAINNSVTIAVNALPGASFSSSALVVCNGNPATLTFAGTPNATVTYTAGSSSQNVTLDAAGNALVVVPNITATTVYSLVDVTAAGPNGCSKALSQSVTISAVPLLAASVSANPLVICSGQGSTISFSGTSNAVITYSINSASAQSVTLNAAGLASVTTGVLSANTTYQLIGVAMTGTGCNRVLSGSVVISVNPIPNAIYSGDLNYCEGEPVLLNLSSAIAGTTFSWTVSQNGTAGAAPGTGNQIAQNVTLSGATAGIVTYTVTPLHDGCTGNPIVITAIIHPVPVLEIMDGVICTTSSAPASSQFYTLNTNLDPASHSFEWFIGGNPIPGASASTYDAFQTGTYTVIATNAAGCVSVPVDAVVSQMPKGESLIIEQSEAFSDDPTVTIMVTGGGGPFLFQLDHGAFQSSNVFYNVVAGTHTINVVDEFCTNLTTTVTIVDYPKFFTPNGDGYNDTWNIKGFDDAVINIFDRYGKLIKQISSNGLGWDGTYNSRLLPSTDYWFTIDYVENGIDKTFRAHFSLKR
jgi:gliding motility-associated-like protein